MTTATVIDHLAVRWRPLAAHLRDPARFGQLSRAVAAGPLGAAIDAETRHSEIICIRTVEVPPVRTTAGVTDDELLGQLATAIAAAIGTAAADTSVRDDCVRYRTRAHAAVDVALALADGDHRRAWAWRQVGLWPDPEDPAAVGELMTGALAESPGMVPSLLSAAAGAGALDTLAGLLGPDRLDTVVRESWQAWGCPLPGWGHLLGSGTPVPEDMAFAEATALLARGALGRELLRGVSLPPQSSAAASAAALLDAEPSLALRPAVLLAPLITATALVALGRNPRCRERVRIETGSTSPSGSGTWAVPSSVDSTVYPPAQAPARPSADFAATQPAGGVATEFGGLPYLLHLIGASGLPERVAQGELAGTGLVALLYQIGARVLRRLASPGQALDPEDAALACLCGRAPEAHWPSDLRTGEAGPRLSQTADAEADRLIATLRAAIEPSGLAAAPERDLLTTICRRRGRIVADPGWIDVHLDLTEVSMDVRRSGLDLDLGCLPWLGCVVRFVYG